LNKSENIYPLDYIDVKKVDRNLSYPFIKNSFLICDVGGAAGIDTHQIAKLAYFTIDLDLSLKALKSAKRHADDMGISNSIGFIKASAINMPFRCNLFDMITCFSVLDHIPGKINAQKAICEFSRVTRKNRYVSITVPNKLFLFGTLIMELKQSIDSDAYFEQRFSPKELYYMIKKAGLTPKIFGSRYPTIIGNHIMTHNFPKNFQKIPNELLFPLMKIAGKLFLHLQSISMFKLLGARMGYLSINEAISDLKK
jgi:ubiquinone/menaquinone biosynthesis C-methylase UbiE